jgi:hypothetical protein
MQNVLLNFWPIRLTSSSHNLVQLISKDRIALSLFNLFVTRESNYCTSDKISIIMEFSQVESRASEASKFHYGLFVCTLN